MFDNLVMRLTNHPLVISYQLVCVDCVTLEWTYMIELNAKCTCNYKTQCEIAIYNEYPLKETQKRVAFTFSIFRTIQLPLGMQTQSEKKVHFQI